MELGWLVNVLPDGPGITQTQVCKGGAAEGHEVSGGVNLKNVGDMQNIASNFIELKHK